MTSWLAHGSWTVQQKDVKMAVVNTRMLQFNCKKKLPDEVVIKLWSWWFYRPKYFFQFFCAKLAGKFQDLKSFNRYYFHLYSFENLLKTLVVNNVKVHYNILFSEVQGDLESYITILLSWRVPACVVPGNIHPYPLQGELLGIPRRRGV